MWEVCRHPLGSWPTCAAVKTPLEQLCEREESQRGKEAPPTQQPRGWSKNVASALGLAGGERPSPGR